MKIHFLKSKPTDDQMREMLEALDGYIKVAVDIKRFCLTGGGIMHADCEEVILREGSRQEDVWGADWYPHDKRVAYHSLINIRPRQNNRSMEIQDSQIRLQVEKIIRNIFE